MNKVALKVTGIIVVIIAVCVLLGIFVGAPLLRNLKYNNAVKNAEAGNYAVALEELDGIDNYKDVKEKKQTYALEAAKKFYEQGDLDSALSFIIVAENYPEDEKKAEDTAYLKETIEKEIKQ